ncbi:MAG: type I DNA topoisomerase, partial [Candidatus Veblenbacteria bacterium]|nr:type I DNA topoisomerase [Candidatus Veblenbacteria bacterium]
KARTIGRFLGAEFEVTSSMGHVRDLPKSKLGVDVEHDFEPQYIEPPRAKKAIAELKAKAKTADTLYLATDEDREGEAIAWHLAQLLGQRSLSIKRIAFHEITEHAVRQALEHPREIDLSLVNAQQARRVLDRLVGYELSPFLWKKVARGLSAGRVQSAAVRLIVEREREIQAFQKQEYWSIGANFTRGNSTFEAALHELDGKPLDKFGLTGEAQTHALVKELEQVAQWSVTSVEKRTNKRSALAPYTTSTLQQDANRRLGFSAMQTMLLAQRLYEGIDLAEGSVGLITYMRTDSTTLADKFLGEVQQFIKQSLGESYVRGPKRFVTKSKNAQEAHEAIRPTDVTRHPDGIKADMKPPEWKLYNLIWRRAVASQLPEAEFEGVSANIVGGRASFRATGSTLTFDGFLKVWEEKRQDTILPALENGETVKLSTLVPEQHFTEPPARYSDASLVKILESHGIGRPSTYAPTIGTIITRGYVERFERRLKPTDLALLVSDLLVEHFPEVVDYEFTAKIETELDDIAEGKAEWVPIVRGFYEPFKEHLTAKEKEVKRSDVMKERIIGTDPKTGQDVKVRIGRYGPYIQLGSGDDKEKPKFAAIPRSTTADEVTLEQALKLLELPRSLGTDPETQQEVLAGFGRFGPYIKRGEGYRSLKETDDVLTIGLERALEIFRTELPKSGTIAVLGKHPQSGVEI